VIALKNWTLGLDATTVWMVSRRLRTV